MTDRPQSAIRTGPLRKRMLARGRSKLLGSRAKKASQPLDQPVAGFPSATVKGDGDAEINSSPFQPSTRKRQSALAVDNSDGEEPINEKVENDSLPVANRIPTTIYAFPPILSPAAAAPNTILFGGVEPYPELRGIEPYRELRGREPYPELRGVEPYPELRGVDPFLELGDGDPYPELELNGDPYPELELNGDPYPELDLKDGDIRELCTHQ